MKNDIMLEKFKKLYHTEKRLIIAQLGTPVISFQTLTVYSRNQMWLVLHFQEQKLNGELHSLLDAVTFYDKNMRLLWSDGLRLLPLDFKDHLPQTVGELLKRHGEPHCQIGSGKTVLLYLAETGQIIFMNIDGERITDACPVNVSELAGTFNIHT